VSVVLIVAIAVLGRLLLLGAVAEDRARTAAYVVAVIGCLLASLFAGLRGAPVSLTSVGLLCAAYVPFCFTLRPEFAGLFKDLLRFFTKIMTGIAVIAIGAFAAQLAGVWHYTDLLASVVPGEFLIPGYSTSYPIQYGSEIYKSNAFVLLEPSFCSQFLAVAVIAQLLLGEQRRRILLYCLAMVTTVSGTGIVLLAVGVAIEVVRRGWRFALMTGSLAAVVLTGVLASPLGHIYSQRSTEITDRSSSAHQRFIEPYTRTWGIMGRSDAVLLAGEGPGFTDRDARRFIALTQLPLTNPPIAKLIDEYGFIAGLLFAAFLAYALTVRVPTGTLAGALAVSFFALSTGSLLVAHTIFLCWLFGSLFARPAPLSVPSVLHGARARAAPSPSW
jgi:hypothetical protein